VEVICDTGVKVCSVFGGMVVGTLVSGGEEGKAGIEVGGNVYAAGVGGTAMGEGVSGREGGRAGVGVGGRDCPDGVKAGLAGVKGAVVGERVSGRTGAKVLSDMGGSVGAGLRQVGCGCTGRRGDGSQCRGKRGREQWYCETLSLAIATQRSRKGFGKGSAAIPHSSSFEKQTPGER